MTDIKKIAEISPVHEDEHIYRQSKMRELYSEEIPLTKNGCYLYLNNTHELVIEYALMQFHHSDGTDDPNENFFKIVFEGYGMGDRLREMRHTYWGDQGDGYTFYLPGKAVIEALTILQKYFDMD